MMSLSQVSDDDASVMAGRRPTSVAGTRKQEDSLCALPEPSIAPCSGARNVG